VPPRKPRVQAKSKASGGDVELTHSERVMFPDAGLTKGDLFDFYRRVAPKLLPHLRDRPMTLERLPAGVGGGAKAPHFWQKHTPAHYPDWIARIRLPSERGEPVEYVLVNDEAALLYLVNQGTITFHPFLSRVGSLDSPDYVLFDVDPHQSTFANAVAVAKALREELEKRGVEALVKTSGKSGLHVVTPWKSSGGYDEARAWALGIAEAVAARLPDVATTERNIKKRGRRVYVDVMQNARGHHVVPPYVVRATPTATVSMPLDWKELTAKLDPAKFTIATAPARLKGKDPMLALLKGSGK
jgi:bifunctional non-homologous end joining protein LigD